MSRSPDERRDVVSGIRQPAGEPVDEVRRNGRQRDHHAGGAGPFEHLLGRLDPAEHVDAADANLVGADEPHDPVPEVGRALRSVEQTDGVGVGADDEDRPADLPLPAHAHEDSPGDHPLDGEEHRDEHQHGDGPQPGQLGEPEHESDRDHHADAHQAGLDDATELLARPLHGTRQIQPVQRERDRPHREGEEREDQVGTLQARFVRSHEGLPGEREDHSQRHDQCIDGHQALLQRRWRDEMCENHRFRGAQIYIRCRQTARHAARLFNCPPVSKSQGNRAVAPLQFTVEKSSLHRAFRSCDVCDKALTSARRPQGAVEPEEDDEHDAGTDLEDQGQHRLR